MRLFARKNPPTPTIPLVSNPSASGIKTPVQTPIRVTPAFSRQFIPSSSKSHPSAFPLSHPQNTGGIISENASQRTSSLTNQANKMDALKTMLQSENPKMSAENLQTAASQITKFIYDENAQDCNLSNLDIKALPVDALFKEKLSKRCTHLNLSENKLSKLPNQFLSPRNSLIYLDLSKNPITALPDWCYGSNKTTILGKILASMNENSTFESNGKPYQTKLQTLILDSTHLPKLSDRIKNHTDLKKLSIEKTKISLLPPLPLSLKELNASHTPLIALPSNIDQLNLKKLNLQGTKVTILPPEFRKLPLQELNLSDNPQIKHLPSCLFSLKTLEILDCNGTHLEEIPSKINNLVSLKKISLQKTLIKELPSELFDLPQLKYIDLKYSKIQCISNEDGNEYKLLYLKTVNDSNPLWDQYLKPGIYYFKHPGKNSSKELFLTHTPWLETINTYIRSDQPYTLLPFSGNKLVIEKNL